ncbi:hypothetical protein ABW19_dt0204752 [Dactylella cylindrospora]|nr:hypothetical protein ABW19_dt0204752 [Dactylella cylindrospora]
MAGNNHQKSIWDGHGPMILDMLPKPYRVNYAFDPELDSKSAGSDEDDDDDDDDDEYYYEMYDYDREHESREALEEGLVEDSGNQDGNSQYYAPSATSSAPAADSEFVNSIVPTVARHGGEIRISRYGSAVMSFPRGRPGGPPI